MERRLRARTLEALKDVDEGRVIEHADVEAWAAKLTPRKRVRRR